MVHDYPMLRATSSELRTKMPSPPSDESGSYSSEWSFYTCESRFSIDKPSSLSDVARKKTYFKTRKKKALNKFEESALATQ